MSSIVKSVAVAAAATSDFFKAFTNPTCTDTITNYRDELDWVNGAINTYLVDTEHLLDAIWQQELKLSQCNGNTGRHLRFDPADPVLIAHPPKAVTLIANSNLDEDQVDFVVTMMTAEGTATIDRVTVQNEPAAGNHDEKKLSSQSNNAFAKVEAQERQEPEQHESTSEAIGNAPRH